MIQELSKVDARGVCLYIYFFKTVQIQVSGFKVSLFVFEVTIHSRTVLLPFTCVSITSSSSLQDI